MHILLVEDDEIDQMAFKRIFKEYPCTFSIANTIKEAKQLIASENFDVIISDYQLPDGTGINILEIGLSIPIIMTTGTGREEIAIKALKSGAVEYLIKDLNRNYLKNLPGIIEQAITRKKIEHLTLMLTRVIKGIKHGACISNNYNRVTFVNQAFCELFDFKSEDLLEKYESEITNEIDRHITSRVKLDESSYEFTYQHPNGKSITCNVSRSDVEDENHQIIATVTIYRDITKHVEMELELRKNVEELARARAELEQLELFSFVSTHDLLEPLHKIVTLGNLIIADPDVVLSEAAKAYQQSLIKAVEEMWQMISQLHDYSKILSAGAPFTDVNLNVVAGDVCDKLKPQIDELKAKIQISELPVIKGDQRQLYKVFLNIMRNALTFRNKTIPPEIKISAVETEQSITIIVEDNGIGIDEKFIPRLFKPFQRLHTLSEYPGRGLGLAICKRVMQRHSGSISATSTLGKGSTFQLNFPKYLENS